MKNSLASPSMPNGDAPTSAPSDSARQNRLSQAVDEFYAAIDAGQAIDRGRLLEKYADVADELEECLANFDFIQQVAPQLTAMTADQPEDRVAADQRASLGDYRLLRELGRGGMGVVYEAEQLTLGRRVALKVLPFAAMLDKQQLARFKNEARAAATLDHPNIVAIYSVGSERGVHYYAMQLVEGDTLAQVIAEHRRERGINGDPPGALMAPTASFNALDGAAPAPAADPAAETRRDPQAALSTLPAFDSREYYRSVARLGIQAAEALDHAHQNGVLHRDIKPGNLMVDATGKLWVTDFGLARIEQDAGMTMTGDLVGTIRYMSPEQALAKRVVVDHRSDIYSLGVTLYEILTLRPAYLASDRQELLREIAFEEPRRLRQINGHIPQDLETIVLKAMEKNPADRYATAQQLADDLQRYLASEPIKARPATVRQRVLK